MGSQYIRDTTYLKTRHKKIKEVSQIGFWGIYQYFKPTYGVFISERDEFSTEFSTFSTMEKVDG